MRPTYLLLAMSIARSALAQAPSDSGAADLVFKEGIRLRDVGETVQACAKFEAARDLDATSGTLLVLADCYERLGRTASAYSAFADTVILADKEKRLDRATEAKRRQALLEPKLSRIALVVSSPVPGLKIARDGRDIPPTIFSTPLPVDPGMHEITASSDGYRPWTTRIVIEGVGATTVSVPSLEALPPSSTKEEPAVPPPPPDLEKVTNTPRMSVDAAPPAQLAEQHPAGKGSARRTTGIAFTIAGAVGLGTGMYFGFAARRDWNDSSSHCTNETVCDKVGYDLVTSANRNARIADIAVGIGAGAAVFGVILWVTAPSRAPAGTQALRVVPQLTTSSTGFALESSF